MIGLLAFAAVAARVAAGRRPGPALPGASAVSARHSQAAPPPEPLSGTRYYVDCKDGNDRGAGTSPASAWATLGKASAAPLKPGDALLLAAGCTFDGTLRASWHGTASAAITIGSYGSGPAPVIHQSVNNTEDIAVTGSYLVIRGLDLTASPPHRLAACDDAAYGWIVGVDFQPNATHDTLTGSRMSGLYAGAYLEAGAAGNLVTRSVFSGNNMMSPNAASGSAGAFGVLLAGNDNTVSHNTIDGGNQCSLAYGFDGSAVEVFGGSDNLIEYNTASDDNEFTELGNSHSWGNVYAYNLFDTSVPGQGFLTTRGSQDPADGPVNSTILYNNTAYETGAGDVGVVCYAGCDPGVLIMENNIIDTSGQALYADGPFTESHNIFWGINDSPSMNAPALGGALMERNPEFSDAGAGAFGLRPGSPAIGAGIPLPASLGLATDLAGAPVTVPPSIGAYGAGATR